MPFEPARTVARSLGVFADHAGTFVGVTAVVHLPLLALAAWRAASWAAGRGEGTVAGLLAERLLEFVLAQLAAAAVSYGVVETLRRRPAPLGACLRQGLATLAPVLGVGLATGLAVGGSLLLVVLLPVTFFIFIPVAIVLATQLYVAVPAAVMERLGVSFALSRSQMLARGRFWRVLAVAVVFYLLAAAPPLVLELVVPPGAAVAAAVELVEAALGVLTSALLAVSAAVAYHDLRVDAEGVDADELAAVFA